MAALGNVRRWNVENYSAIQRRIRNSIFAEAAISVLIVLVLMIGIVWSLPGSEIKRTLVPTLSPVASAAALDQNWRLFAPNPYRRVESIEVVVTMDDGSNRTWKVQAGNRLIGSFAWGHWRKLMSTSVKIPESRPGIARWVVNELTDSSEKPARVRIIEHSVTLPPPGSDEPVTTRDKTLYDKDLRGDK